VPKGKTNALDGQTSVLDSQMYTSTC